MTGPGTELRLNRFLALAGLGSRRAVEDLVRQGRVAVNGAVVTELGVRIRPEQDEVLVDGAPARVPDSFRVYAFHKPLDVVCTFKSQGGQPTLLPYLRRADLPERLKPVGRLDSDSTGLLLWTDDGELNQRLCRPDSGVWKVYQVTLAAPLAAEAVGPLTDGSLRLDGRACRPCRLEPGARGQEWVMHLHEGRKRQIRRMFRVVGAKVVRLHRIQYGPVILGRLKEGDFRRLDAAEVAALRKAAGSGGGR